MFGKEVGDKGDLLFDNGLQLINYCLENAL